MTTEYPHDAPGDPPDEGPDAAGAGTPDNDADDTAAPPPDAETETEPGADPAAEPGGDPSAETGTDTTDEPDADEPDAGEPDAGEPDAGEPALASIKRILEAALLVAGRPLSITDCEKLFGGSADAPARNTIRRALAELGEDWAGRSLALQEVATGWRAQVRTEFEPWIARLWDEKPPRYSRALLETLAIIAYRQPMTRSEIEDIRGVTVSSQIIRTLTEREWIRVVGHRESPGRPAMYGTTREFLDYFNLKTLDQLPPISDIKDLEGQYPELGFEAEPARSPEAAAGAAGAGSDTVAPESADPDAPEPDTADPDTAGPDTADPDAVDPDAAAPAEQVDGAPAPGESAHGHDTNREAGAIETPPADAPPAADGPGDDDGEDSPCTPAS